MDGDRDKDTTAHGGCFVRCYFSRMTSDAAHRLLRSARSIGIIRTDRLGDMVCTLPLVQLVRNEFPDAQVHLITRSYCAPLVRDTPAAHHVQYLDERPLRDILAATPLDALFFPRPVAGEAWAAARAGIPLRVGSAYRLYAPLFSLRVHDHRKESRYHEVEYNVRMLSAITGKDYTPQLVPPVVQDASRSAARRLVRERGIQDSRRIVVIHPSSGGSAREWPAERFGELAARLGTHPDVQVVVTGTSAEAAACAQVIERAPAAVNLCGVCPLDVMIALAEHASLLVANSTGILHIAAALGTKVVGLFPSTPSMSAARWGPYAPAARVISSGEFAPDDDIDNLSFIPVQRVFDLCMESLSDPLP